MEYYVPRILFLVLMAIIGWSLGSSIRKFLVKKGFIGAVISSVPIKEYEPSEDEEED